MKTCLLDYDLNWTDLNESIDVEDSLKLAILKLVGIQK